MSETVEQIKQTAYARGQQMQQWQHQKQLVVNDEALMILAADFAQVTLFKFNQLTGVVAAHERAGICEKAFLEGYRSQLP